MRRKYEAARHSSANKRMLPDWFFAAFQPAANAGVIGPSAVVACHDWWS